LRVTVRAIVDGFADGSSLSRHTRNRSRHIFSAHKAEVVSFGTMTLADQVAQSREPFVVLDVSGRRWPLNNTADCAAAVAACSTRYVLADELTHLCADLAYSKGARTVECADLLHVPATALWVEWCNEPWERALQRCGFPPVGSGIQRVGRRGALIRATPDGRRGVVRTFWTVGSRPSEALASCMEACFDFDTPEGDAPVPLDQCASEPYMRVEDGAQAPGEGVLARCFRFRYERSWREYYAQALLSDARTGALEQHALGTIAMDIPLLLAFFLLLSTRGGLPRQHRDLTSLNRSRKKLHRAPLLDHIEVRAPLLRPYLEGGRGDGHGIRRSPRLHHVRGHLMRHGSQLIWRVPHLRGSARSGRVQTRTVVWTFDGTPEERAQHPELRPSLPQIERTRS
jgi:hypothetical protein